MQTVTRREAGVELPGMGLQRVCKGTSAGSSPPADKKTKTESQTLFPDGRGKVAPNQEIRRVKGTSLFPSRQDELLKEEYYPD